MIAFPKNILAKRVLPALAIVLIGFSAQAKEKLADTVIIKEQIPTSLPKIQYYTKDSEYVFTPRAKLTILHFWATWCIPCLKELPELDYMYGQYKDKGLFVLPLAEQQQDAIPAIQEFYTGHNITNLPIVVDPGMHSIKSFDFKGLPASLFINAKGDIIARAEGPMDWNQKETREFLDEILGGQSGAHSKPGSLFEMLRPTILNPVTQTPAVPAEKPASQ